LGLHLWRKGKESFKYLKCGSYIELESIRARFEEELARLKDVLASGVPPEIPKDYGPSDYPCTYCKYRPRCYGT
jgi:hypothetical protein